MSADPAQCMTDVREASPADIPLLEKIAAGMGRRKEEGYFDRCFVEGRRIFIAGEAGYVQLNPRSNYDGFRRQGIPEVQDLAVLAEFRNRGLGRALVECCEAAVREGGGAAVGISVGLDAGYGAAQRLYARMGYVPDGAGAAYDDIPLRRGDMRPLDDNLTLKMAKSLL
jgi:GNAT superfamily N-acetyltransferase